MCLDQLCMCAERAFSTFCWELACHHLLYLFFNSCVCVLLLLFVFSFAITTDIMQGKLKTCDLTISNSFDATTSLSVLAHVVNCSVLSSVANFDTFLLWLLHTQNDLLCHTLHSPCHRLDTV